MKTETKAILSEWSATLLLGGAVLAIGIWSGRLYAMHEVQPKVEALERLLEWNQDRVNELMKLKEQLEGRK